MTLIAVGNSEGERRCTERCYDAKGPICTCVCGGLNHGKGVDVARANTAVEADRIIQRMTGQLPLFSSESKEVLTI